jgi:hypothetical protein
MLYAMQIYKPVKRRGPLNVPSRHLPGEIQEEYKNPQSEKPVN